MKNQKELCKELVKKWKELKEELPKAQQLSPEKAPNYFTHRDTGEFYNTIQKLKDQCPDFLSPKERNEIDRELNPEKK